MNTNIIADKAFKIYQILPHCYINRVVHTNKWRGSLNYELLKDASIISCNCVGGEISHLLGLGFNSPFVNVSIDRNVFVHICNNLEKLMQQDLHTFLANDMVCGILIDGEKELPIKFPHDNDPGLVAEKWNRRKQRINYDKLVFICDDKGITFENAVLFDSIPSFRSAFLYSDYSKYGALKNGIHLDCARKGVTADYNGKSLGGLYKFCGIWDFVSFLNGELI